MDNSRWSFGETGFLTALAVLLFAMALPAQSDAAEAASRSSAILTITTYDTGNEGHLITFPDSTTLSIDCADGTITTKSHFHADHCAACDSGQYNRNNVVPGQFIYSKDGVTVQCVAANGRVIGEEALYVACPASDENKMSMALLVKYRGFDYVTSGDLTASYEGNLGSALAARGVKVDVLKVSHHGSSGSSRLSYLQDILPEYAVISGTASSPTEQTLGNLASAGVNTIYYAPDYSLGDGYPVYRADGDIVITTDGYTYSFSGENPYFYHGPYQVDEYVPTPTPLPVPPPTPAPPQLAQVATNSSSFTPGEPLRVNVAIRQLLDRPFDAYVVIFGPAGVYSIKFGNSLSPGVSPIARGVFFLPEGYFGTLLEMTVPSGIAGDYQAIIGLADAGARVTGVESAFAWDVAYFSLR
jgi:hypothetical protein